MIQRVELIYDQDCPNVKEARKALLQGFADEGLPPVWVEWERSSGASPPYARSYGSPTILVEGRDVAGSAPSAGSDCCRLYRDSGRFAGAPSPTVVAGALRRLVNSETGGVEMTPVCTIEVFTAGCPACQDTVDLVNRIAGPSARVLVHDMHDQANARRAKSLGVRSVPAVLIDGKLSDCCAGRGPDESTLRAAIGSA